MTSCIGELRVLENQPESKRASELMKEIAVWVEPIMKKRSWFVPLFVECNFGSPNVLGMNHNGGSKIEIRLRRPHDKLSFFELESLIDTMLHELSHIVHHNHSAAFYDLWEELRKELSANLSRGLKGSGAGFDAKGVRVNPEARNPSSMLDARRKATEAAEKRLRQSSLFGSGQPQKLGGSSTLVGLGEAEAVRRATMRRCGEWCGTHDEELSGNQPVAVAVANDSEKKNPKANQAPTASRDPKAALDPNIPKDVEASRPLKVARVDSEWTCDLCTFKNEEVDPICTMCTEGLKVNLLLVLFFFFCSVFLFSALFFDCFSAWLVALYVLFCCKLKHVSMHDLRDQTTKLVTSLSLYVLISSQDD